MERKTNFHDTADVIVVGAGNAAMCAAIAAAEKGASVIVLEKSPEAVKGWQYNIYTWFHSVLL